MYKVIDLQIEGREFQDGHIFETKEKIVENLADYHDIDFSGVDDKDNELSIREYFKFWKIDTTQQKLDWLLEYGEWKIEKVKSKCCNAEIKCLGFDVLDLMRRAYRYECNKCHKQCNIKEI